MLTRGRTFVYNRGRVFDEGPPFLAEIGFKGKTLKIVKTIKNPVYSGFFAFILISDNYYLSLERPEFYFLDCLPSLP